MLLEVYEFITKAQAEIGNGAEIRLSVRDCVVEIGEIPEFSVGNGVLEIRVDWWNDDFHACYKCKEKDLRQQGGDDRFIARFVAWCKNEYANSEYTEERE